MNAGDWKSTVRAVFNGIAPIPETEWEYASSFLVRRDFQKGELLLEAGTVATHSFLLLKGIVRIYYLTAEGKEFNNGFVAERHFCGSVSSIIGGRPSRFFIEALEDCQAVLLPRERVLECYDRHVCWERFGRVIAEGAMMHMEIKEGEVLDSLEERYLRLLRESPDLPARVPQYHIASYLGITHVALSRLRRRLKDREKLPG